MSALHKVKDKKVAPVDEGEQRTLMDVVDGVIIRGYGRSNSGSCSPEGLYTNPDRKHQSFVPSV